jgi:lipoprotein LprG
MALRVRDLSRRGVLAAAAAAALVGLSGCSGDSSGATTSATTSGPPTAAALLATARATIDKTQALSFVLQGTDLPADGNVLVGGTGDVARPDGFQGTLDVRFAGALAKVEVVSTGGDFYAKLPLTSVFAKTDPKALGFGDPGRFMDPQAGLTQLLTKATDPKLAGESRVVSDVVTEVTATLPGSVVADLLTSADPAQDVRATFSVTKDGQLRRAVLVGPFWAKGTDSTYTILLRDYGKNVSISAPG